MQTKKEMFAFVFRFADSRLIFLFFKEVKLNHCWPNVYKFLNFLCWMLSDQISDEQAAVWPLVLPLAVIVLARPAAASLPPLSALYLQNVPVRVLFQTCFVEIFK